MAYRTQELDLESLYFLGNSNQTGMTLDGTGNYTGGTFFDNAFNGFQTAVNAIGHQIANPATTDWMNASTFVRLHIDCPTSGEARSAGRMASTCSRGMETHSRAATWRDARQRCTWGRMRRTTRLWDCATRTRPTRLWRTREAQYNNWMTGGTMFTGTADGQRHAQQLPGCIPSEFQWVERRLVRQPEGRDVTNHIRLGTGWGTSAGC